MQVVGAGRGTFDVWVPDRGLGAPEIGGTNIADVDVVQVDGGWRVRGCRVRRVHDHGEHGYGCRR